MHGAPKNNQLATKQTGQSIQLVHRRPFVRLFTDFQPDDLALLRFLDGLVFNLHRIHRLLELGAIALDFDFVADPQTAGKLDDSHTDLPVVVGDFADLGHSEPIIPSAATIGKVPVLRA